MTDYWKDRGPRVRARIRGVLNEDWDPVLAAIPGGVDDEYDSYVQPIYYLLAGGGTKQDLAGYLWHLRTACMRLSDTQSGRLVDERVAERLLAIPNELNDMPDPSAFIAALSQSAAPAAWSGPLVGLWHAAKGNWEAAHDAVRLDESAEAAWVHAHLHRIEGDLDNARYWYGQAGRPYTAEPLEAERATIAAELLST
jgi:hypothetical protein